jgi:hypothetical protein
MGVAKGLETVWIPNLFSFWLLNAVCLRRRFLLDRPAFEYSVTFASSKQQNDNLPPCNVEIYYASHVGTVAILFTF